MKSTGTTARAAVFGLWALLSASAAHAQQQFTLVDTTYTATAQNTNDSHYEATPASGIPSNWQSPTDYTQGKAYVEIDILEKPSDQSTLFNICFTNDSGSACLPYGPAYTATGHIAWNANFMDFWNFMVVDWSKGVKQVDLILKDMMQNKKQGDAAFYPYKAHVVVTIVPKGATYVMPANSGGAAGSAPGAGSGGAGGRVSGSAGRRAAAGSGGMRANAGSGTGSGGAGAGAAGKASGSAGNASAPAGTASDAGVQDAGAAGSTGAAKGGAGITSSAANGGSGGKLTSSGTAGSAGDAQTENSQLNAKSQLEDSSGCTIARVRGRSGWAGGMLWLALAGLIRARRRRR